MNDCNLSGGDAVLRVKALEQQVAALEAEKARGFVPDGFALRPTVPTRAMKYAAEDTALSVHVSRQSTQHEIAEQVYQAMNDAAPVPAWPLSFQDRVEPWLLECFGEVIAGDKAERNHRFLEEALELVQACECTADEAHKLVDYVYGRPVGEKRQEIGGVMVTLAALCIAQGLDMHAAGDRELSRIMQPEVVVKIREKQKRKPAMSPLPGAYPDRPAPAERNQCDGCQAGIPAAIGGAHQLPISGGQIAGVTGTPFCNTAPAASDVAGLIEALRQYRHNDGSDGFVFGYDKEMTDRYVAGLAQGGAADLERIRHLVDLATAAHFREMESRTAGLVEALEEIVSPVTFMKKRLKSDEKLEGFYAQQLSSDPNYLKQIAARALAALATFHREG
jgi:hypothetical protein